jgi:16S rRNA processing protein RimM
MKTAEKYLLFGEILKTFGANGELIVKLVNKTPLQIDLHEPVFIIIDGLQVPFYFKIFDERANNRALIVLENIETERLASQIVGMKILLPYKKQIGKKDFNLNDFVGFEATDAQCGELGKISAFLDFPNNPCLQIIRAGKEILIPVNADLIQAVDMKLKIINFDLPEGLVNFYMNS